MKMKRMHCLLSLALPFVLLTQVAFATETVASPTDLVSSPEFTEPVVAEVYTEVIPQLEHEAEVSEEGKVYFETGTLIDLILPETLNGEPITRIGEGCFKGCNVIRSVTIPSAITEIGADAFTDCPYLEVIYFADRADAKDLTLGENWSGEAEVAFLLVAVEEDESQKEPSEEETSVEYTEASEQKADANVAAESSEEQFEQPEDTLPDNGAVFSNELSAPTVGATEGGEPSSDVTDSEGSVVVEEVVAGEGIPPSELQPSDFSEGAGADPASEPAADPAAT